MKVPREVLTVARHLGEMRSEVVFVGGMVRGLLVTDPAVDGPRPTKDVDLIFDVRSRVGFSETSARLRTLGFKEDRSEDAPICRYVLKNEASDESDLPVDFMPLDPAILGFSNVWYPDAFANPDEVNTDVGSIRVIHAPYFIGTKLESFASRGEGDFYHHDLEDIVVLVDGRPELLAEISDAPRDLRDFIAQEFKKFLSDQDFLEKLPGHLPGDAASQRRIGLLLGRLAAIADLAPAGQTLEAEPHDALLHIRVAGQTLEAFRPLRSSHIRLFAYDPATSVLTVQFEKDRIVYEYYEVPAAIFEGWRLAASAGHYHHRWIRNRYRYRRLGVISD